MELKQGLHLGQRLEQRLVMTQQLQQAIRLLQLSRTELVEAVHDALLENPVLEERAAISDGSTDSSPSSVTSGEGEVKNLDAPVQTGTEPQEIDWQAYFTDLARGPVEGPREYRSSDEEKPTLEQTLATAEVLSDVLLEQLRLNGMVGTDLAIAEEIIGNLDGDGYFRPSRLELSGGSEAGRRLLRRKAESQGIETSDDRVSLSLLWLDDPEADEWRADAEGRGFKARFEPGNSTRLYARVFGVSPLSVHAVLRAVQGCEPTGIASRDLRECLLTQAYTEHPAAEDLHRLIECHLPNIEKRTYNPVLRDLKIDAPALKTLIALLATLEPRPARSYGGGSTRYITPDVYVRKIGDDYSVTVNEDGLPRLRLSRFYQNALSDGHGKEAKDYLQEKMRSAVWLIRSIQQRQSTIQRVTESVMKFQRGFLDQGIAHLKPLVLRDVAEDVGLHESTVSRVTTSKYVHTPQGIYELKFFFNSRIETRTGDGVASEAVKHAIARLIEREQIKAPLSDQEIGEILQGKWDRGQMLSRLDCSESEADSLRPRRSMSIARRTVAKYREALDIPSSTKRRRML